MTEQELAAIEARATYTDAWGKDNQGQHYGDWADAQIVALVAEVRRLQHEVLRVSGAIPATVDDSMRHSIAAQIERGGGDGKPGGAGMPYGY